MRVYWIANTFSEVKTSKRNMKDFKNKTNHQMSGNKSTKMPTPKTKYFTYDTN